jgi:peptide/nickel transport system substrate-binding protein
VQPVAVQTIRRNISMKRNLALRALATAAATALLAGAFSVGALAPAQAATKSTVTLLSAGDITSLNPSTKGNNTTYNNLSASLTGFGFYYYNSDAELVMNTKFGSMKILKKSAKDFQLQYTVAPGQTWSDGTKIDAVDLLLTHVISSSKYSKAAGLGDPADATKKPAFDSLGYGGAYDDNVVGEPKLSNGNMVLTVKYSKPLPDWELLAPGPSPVHALSLLADGKKGLQSASVNAAAKAKFLKDFTSKNATNLKKIGAVWTTGYNVNKVDKDTNPLLLISNGGFIISKYTFGNSMTLVRNPKYSSGPAMATKNPIKTVVIKVINDNTAQTQALRNGDIDILYNTNPTGADKITLAGMSNVKTSINVGGSYSIFHLRTDTAYGFDDQYTGPFAGNSQRAKDLRKAYLLATPREQMVSTLIAPVKSDATSMNTQFVFQGTPAYNTITKSSGVDIYTKGTQAERTAAALKLVQKYYPTASATNSPVTVKYLTSDTTLRNALAALTKAETKKAGFNTEIVLFPSIFADDINYSSKYDVVVHGFSINSLSQSASTDTYKTDGVNNAWGWSDSALDAILKSLESDILTPKEITAKRLAADKIIVANAWGLPLYAGPIITAYNKDLKNIKPAPVGNNITWNYFQWSY